MGKLISLEYFPQISLDCGEDQYLKQTPNNTLYVISSLLHVMSSKLPIKDLPATTIAFSENRNTPICFRNCGLIILSAHPNRWDQFSYQLAHEICHRVIPSDVVKNLRWLEESICELSSYYFLPLLTKNWRRKRIPLVYAKTNKPYYPAFEKYVKNERKKAVPFDLSSFLSQTPSDELQMLINDCEIREKNAYIAVSLLPIFKQYPNTWYSIPLLGNLTASAPLRYSLEEWIKLSPEESRVGLQQIARLFGA